MRTAAAFDTAVEGGAATAPATTPARRAASLAIALLFVVGMMLPCLGTIAGVATGGLPGENRPAAQPVDWSAPPDVVRKQSLAWFNDHFGFRNWLVRGFGLFAFRVFGVSVSRDVVPGRDGWLFYDADRIVAARRGLVPFTPDELASWQKALEARRDWLAARGITYVFAIAPEKSSLYAEHLPGSLQPTGAPTRADQLLTWMRQHSTVPALDFRPALGAAKERERLYHVTDTHWNDAGAFVAYRELAAWLQTEFPAFQPLDRDLFERQVHRGGGGDLAAMMAIGPMLTEDRIVYMPKAPTPVAPLDATDAMRRRQYPPNNQPKVFAARTGELGRAVVVHDSFFIAVQPWIARHFQRSVFLRSIFAAEVIDDERPDVVIEEMIERVLSRPGFDPAAELPG